MAKTPCTHRYVQARHVGNGRWRVYCTKAHGVVGCGKWMRHIKATGPDTDTAIVSGASIEVAVVTIIDPSRQIEGASPAPISQSVSISSAPSARE